MLRPSDYSSSSINCVPSINSISQDRLMEREDIYQQIIYNLNILKNNYSQKNIELKLCNLIIANIDYLLYECQDIADELVQLWMNEKSNSPLFNIIIWLLSVYSFLSHEYPIHIQVSILKWVASLKLSGKKLIDERMFMQKLEIVFKHNTSLMIDNYSQILFGLFEPFWLKNLRNNISLQAKLNISFLNAFNFSKELLETNDFKFIVQSLLKFSQHDLAIEILDWKISSFDERYSLDIGYCQLWLCSIIIEKSRNNVIDLYRIPFNELSYFIKEVIFSENGLIQKSHTSGNIVDIPKNLFHLFEDASISQKFILNEQFSINDHLVFIVERLIIASTHFRNGGNLKIAIHIYQRLIEYYNQIPNSEIALEDLHKQCSLWNIDRKEGIEYLSKYCKYFLVSVKINAERQEDYIYRSYHFENIDSLIENRIKTDFPNFNILNARNAQLLEGSIRILPAFEEKSNCFIVYDYQREDDKVFPEDDKIFGCSKSRHFIGDVDIFNNHMDQEYSIMILRARIISSISVFDETNQMHANLNYLTIMDKYIKRTSQILAQNIVNGISLTESTICYNLFLFIGNLIFDVMEGGKLDYILGLNQCKQIIYCYKGIYRDELADRKKDIRRKWMKERKFAAENKIDLPLEPSLTNLIEHNEEFLNLKDAFNQLMISINHSFVLYKELGTAVYKNHKGVTETLERIEILKLQTLTLLNELSSVIEEITMPALVQ